MLTRRAFGDDFIWGAATSAAQSEGAWNEDGRGPSIWDTFAAQSKNLSGNNGPAKGSDFYHQYPNDIRLLGLLGFKNFRFSISWSRILPNGQGRINQKGLSFYHRLIDLCLLKGITPWCTLYHWDLPQALQDKGGWANRDIINYFEDYVQIVTNEFGDKVKHWMVLNEPTAFTGVGYFLGLHAPGKRGLSQFLPAMHHAALCQPIGEMVIRSNVPYSYVGTTYSCTGIHPHSQSVQDVQAAERMDAMLNRLFIEPAMGLDYPVKSLPVLRKVYDYFGPNDEKILPCNFDFIGLQPYTREVVSHRFIIPYLQARLIPANERSVQHTAMNWEVYPPVMREMVEKFAAYSNVKDIIITENGAAFPDQVIDGRIDDQQRQSYFVNHLKELQNCVLDGLPVKGYFVWSLTDNFEWAESYRPRFGLIYVDYEDQTRIVKDSGYWFQRFLSKTN